MKCPRCKSKMIKVDLRFSSFVGHAKYAYKCPKCENNESITKNKKGKQT